jgi:F0F1-type ATP synthase assembly protein I
MSGGVVTQVAVMVILMNEFVEALSRIMGGHKLIICYCIFVLPVWGADVKENKVGTAANIGIKHAFIHC